MKMLRYTVEVEIPAHIAATDPAVRDEISAMEAGRYARLIAAARHLDRAVHRYDQSLHTKDEKRSRDSVLINARSLCAAFKDLSKEV